MGASVSENNTAIALLSEQWRHAGVESGDTLLLHSSAGRTLRRLKSLGFAPNPHTLLDSFLHCLGDDGTLLLPLFNFDFTNGTPFDIRSTPSQMGALTEAARQRPECVRTGHPIYSFAVLGRQRERFRSMDNFSGYGADSPFAILHREYGKIAVLDLPDQNSMTFYHYVEEALAVEYRFHKSFPGQYTDANGDTSTRNYGIFVRDVERGVVTHVDPMGEILWNEGLYSGERPGVGSGLRVIEAARLFDAVKAVIEQGNAKGLLYDIQQ